jgi:heavy metal sensor kinase
VARLRAFFSGIRIRLMVWFIAILALVLVMFSVFIYTRQSQDLNEANLNHLALKTRQLETAFQFEGLQSMQDVRQLMASMVSAGVPLVDDSEVLVIADPFAQWSAQIGPVNQSEINRMVTTAQQVVQGNQQRMYDFSLVSSTTNQNQQYEFLITPILAHGRLAGYMLFGQPSDPTGTLPRLIATLAIASLAILLGAGAGGYWLAGRILRPVKVITQTAQKISETDLSQRLNFTSSDELGELATTFDTMLARLEAGFERQRQFTADASHELRTPLTIIGLETDSSLAMKRKPDEYVQTLQMIKNENEHMARLVNDLLVLSRMESGQAHMQQDMVDLSDVALEVVERLSPLAAIKEIHLEAGDLPEVKICGDRAYLSQMISNLVGNAIKYVPAGDGMVRIETGQRDSMGWVRVEDNGPGIAAEDMPHLFERFYRADKSRSRQDSQGDPGGSGLGLAIVRSIALAHGGETSVTSTPGEGSAFEVALPLKN